MDRRGNFLETILSVKNVGTGAALLGPPLRRPLLIVNWALRYECVGGANPAFLPVNGIAQITFRTVFNTELGSSEVPWAPCEVHSGSVSFRYMDAAKSYCHRTEMTFDVSSEPTAGNRIARLHLKDISHSLSSID